MLRQNVKMKTALTFAVLEYILFFCCLQQFGLAAPTVGADEDISIISSDVKRGAVYRNALFGVYSCRVKKATDAVRDKLKVRLSFSGFCTYAVMYL